jgi:hypothetical protein
MALAWARYQGARLLQAVLRASFGRTPSAKRAARRRRFQADALCTSCDLPDSPLKTDQGLWRDCALDLRLSGSYATLDEALGFFEFLVGIQAVIFALSSCAEIMLARGTWEWR